MKKHLLLWLFIFINIHMSGINITANGVVSNPYCPNDSGSVTINISGGTAPYQYELNGSGVWLDFNSQYEIRMLSDYYSIVVRDANQNTALPVTGFFVPLNQSPNPPITQSYFSCQAQGTLHVSSLVSTIQGIICWHDSQGESILTPGSISKSNIGEYQYGASVKSTSGCYSTIEPLYISIYENPQILDVYKTDTTNIVIEVSGGSGIYKYSVDGKSGFCTSFVNIGTLSTGNYDFIVEDDNGCSSSVNFDINTNITAIEGVNNSSFKLLPNPARDQIMIKNSSNNNGTYLITSQAGKQVLTGIIHGETTIIDIHKLDVGVYFFQINQEVKQTIKVIKK